MKKEVLRRYDLVFSLLLMAGALLYIIECIKLFFNPFGRDWQFVSDASVKETITQWYKSPALLPMIVGFLLLVCGISLFHIAKHAGAKIDFISKDTIKSLKNNKELVVFIQVASLLALYIFALIPLCRNYLDFFRGFKGFPFMVATALYIFAMSVLFSNKKKLLKSAGIAIIAALVISLLFNKAALIPLP